MAIKRRDLGKETRWRDILKRYAASGLSVRAFCQQEQVTESSFYAWRRTIGERNGTKKATVPAFMPAVMGSEPVGAITIKFSGGRLLRLPTPISATWVAEFVHALESRAES